jgi:hypothetical protein
MDSYSQFPKYGKAGCCPTAWNETPNMTGDPYTDASIFHSKNPDAKAKLTDHLVTDVAYSKNTSYSRSSID